MSRVRQYLKPAWVQRHFELALALLPATTSVALWLDGKCLLTTATTPVEGEPGVMGFPLLLQDAPVGVLLLAPPAGEAGRAEAWAATCVHVLQSMLDAEHARHSVGQEALESYREMALLQRAVTELNRSLKPAAVSAALLREFDGRKNGADFGAVFLRAQGGSDLELTYAFGGDAATEFGRLRHNPLFEAMAAGEVGDINNELPATAREAMAFGALLWLPLIAHGERLGLLVLGSRRTEAFAAGDMKRAQTLASVAAAALRNAQLYAAEQNMFQAFVQVIATAIDAKSPYTAGHCRRVPEIALMLAEAAGQAASGPFADFSFDEEVRNALHLAALLHDCGKMVTPEWVVDKATKLNGITDRIDLVAMRFEVLRREATIDYWRTLAESADRDGAAARLQARLGRIDDDLAFVERCNQGSEFISAEHMARLTDLAHTHWPGSAGGEFPLLTDNELHNLATARGTLNPEERKIIEDHAVHTYNMLSQIPFPHALRNVTEYAASHHERINGSGYPRHLKGDQLSIPARIVAIADIFEALTAPDRPYRKAGKLGWAIDVMHRMRQDNHIDSDLFDLFLRENIYLTYAQRHLAPGQIEAVDTSRYLGQAPA